MGDYGYHFSRCFVNDGVFIPTTPSNGMTGFPIMGVNAREKGSTEDMFLDRMFARCNTKPFQATVPGGPPTEITDTTNYRYLDIYLSYTDPQTAPAAQAPVIQAARAAGVPEDSLPIYLYIADPIGANQGKVYLGEHGVLPSLGYWDNTRNATLPGQAGKLRTAEMGGDIIGLVKNWVEGIIATQNLLPLIRGQLNYGNVVKFTTDYYPSRSVKQAVFHKDSLDARTMYFGLMYKNAGFVLGPDVKAGITIPAAGQLISQTDPANVGPKTPLGQQYVTALETHGEEKNASVLLGPAHAIDQTAMSAIRPIIPPEGSVWLNDMLLHHSTPVINGPGTQYVPDGVAAGMAMIEDSRYQPKASQPSNQQQQRLLLVPPKRRDSWAPAKAGHSALVDDSSDPNGKLDTLDLSKMSADLIKDAHNMDADVAAGSDTMRPPFCRVWIQSIDGARFAEDYDTRKNLDQISLAKLLNIDREALGELEMLAPGSTTAGGPGGAGSIQQQFQNNPAFGFNPSALGGYVRYSQRAAPNNKAIEHWQQSTEGYFSTVLQATGQSLQSGLFFVGDLDVGQIAALHGAAVADMDIVVTQPALDHPGNPDGAAPEVNAIIHRIAHEEDWSKAYGMPNIGGSRKTRRKRHKRHKPRKTSSRRSRSNKKLKKTKSKPRKRVKKSRKQYK